MRKIFCIACLIIFVTIAACSKKEPVKEEKVKLEVDTAILDNKKSDNKVKNMQAEMEKLKQELKEMKQETPVSEEKQEIIEDEDYGKHDSGKENIKIRDIAPSKILKSSWCVRKPRIDGLFKHSEWADCKKIEKDISLKDIGGNEKGRIRMELFVKNDNTNLYIAVKIIGDDLEDNFVKGIDGVIVRFDNNDNGYMDSNEDYKFAFIFQGKPKYEDKHFLTGPEKRSGKKEKDMNQDGRGVMRYYVSRRNKIHETEFKFPLDSGDREDINIGPGSIVRWNIFYLDKFPKLRIMRFGGLTSEKMEVSKDWGYLKLAEHKKRSR